MLWYKPIINGINKIIKYASKKEILKEIVRAVTTSFNKNNKKPIKIAKNNILKKFSFLLNFPENPITVNPITIKNIGFNISDK